MGGLFGMPMGAYQMPNMADTSKPKSWLDGGKFKGKDALALGLGMLGSAFGGRPIMSQMLMQNMMQRRQAEQDEKRAQAQRLASLEDYRAKKEIDLQYPGAPGKPHYWETNDGSLGMVDPVTGKPSILYKDPTPKINWMTVDNGDGTKQIVPVGPNGPMLGGAQPQAYNPDDWEVVEGGPSQPAAGGFRR